MKPSNTFKETIKNYLDKRAAEDELFAITYKKENKTLDECCNYIMKCAKDGGCAGYADEEVFNWAVHYYDEDDIKNIKPVSGKVVVNNSVELTEEDIAEAKQKAFDLEVAKQRESLVMNQKVELTPEDMEKAKKIALDEVVKNEKEKMIKKKSSKKEEPKTEVEQQTLF